MGVFDLFGREPKTREERKERFNAQAEPLYNQQPQQSAPVSVFSPSSYEDVAKIIDVLKTGKNAIIHLDKLKQETIVHVLNMLSGAVYALGGGLYELQKNVYMLSPTGVEMK